VRRALVVYLVSAPSQSLPPSPLSCLVQEGEGIVCLGGTNKGYTVARVVEDGDGSFVLEDAVNIAFRWTTPNQPPRLETNLTTVYSCIFFECHNLDDFLNMAKQHQALVEDRPRSKGA
jgi:hypothetical protein